MEKQRTTLLKIKELFRIDFYKKFHLFVPYSGLFIAFQEIIFQIGFFAKYLAKTHENHAWHVPRHVNGVIYDIYYTGFSLLTILRLENILVMFSIRYSFNPEINARSCSEKSASIPFEIVSDF